MPALQTVQLTPDNPEPTGVEGLFSRYNKYMEERKEGEEVQKLTNKYLENKDQEGAWEKLNLDLMNNQDIGPTKRLETQAQLKDLRTQILKEREVLAKEAKDKVDVALQNKNIQNLVDQGYPVDEAVQYVNGPPSVQNRLAANHLELVQRGLRKPKEQPSKELPPDAAVPLDEKEVVEEWPVIPPPTKMNNAERVDWENKNQKANNDELIKTRAKKKVLGDNERLVKSMTTLNESKRLPKDLSSWVIDPESGGVRTSAQLSGNVNKETALYAKNLAQFIKGAKDVFGARVSNFEVGAFLDQLPTLLNSEQGRRLILKQMDLNNELDKVYNNTMDEALKKYSRSANYADIVDLVDSKVEAREAELIGKLDNVVEASNYLDTMADNPEKFKDTVLMTNPEGKFKAVRKDKVDSAPEGWSVY